MHRITQVALNNLYFIYVIRTNNALKNWGNPLDRDVERIKENAIEGLLSFARAKDVYGVILTQKDKDNPESIEIDYKATDVLRAKMKTKKG
ncbi:hypothetical protein ACFLZG_05875 [Thermodesulfobacteriota bacterium]